jgi:hypothetical protein
MDNTPSLQGHGLQDYHLLVCDAVGIEQAWYQGAVPWQNALFECPIEVAYFLLTEAPLRHVMPRAHTNYPRLQYTAKLILTEPTVELYTKRAHPRAPR